MRTTTGEDDDDDEDVPCEVYLSSDGAFSSTLLYILLSSTVFLSEETVIDFTIARDGQISAMRMEDSTHDVALDKAAWSATKATPYSPPPAGMREPNLKLRVHFTVN